MKRARGSSRLELLVAITLIAVFAAVLLDRLAFYQEAAEKARVEYTISMLKSALRIRMATMMTEGRAGSFASLEQQNPLDWLEDKPAGYTSVAANYASSEKLSGTWQFDPVERTLTYWPLRKSYLQPDPAGFQRIRLKVVAVRDEAHVAQGEGEEVQAGTAAVVSVRLDVDPYRWLQAIK